MALVCIPNKQVSRKTQCSINFINVLKPDGILQSSREDVLNKLKKVTEAQGNMNNISNPPTSEEDEDANSENELAVEYDDDFDDEDDVPLSECLV